MSLHPLLDVLHYLMNSLLSGSSESAQYLLTFIVVDVFSA